jgi:ATP-dependent protease Clp ATPase subunit
MHTTQSACSFCGRRSTQVRDLIASRRLSAAYICDQCIEACHGILKEDPGKMVYQTPAGVDDNTLLTAPLECSFCRRGQSTVDKLISSPLKDAHQYICDRCVRMGGELLGKEGQPGSSRSRRLAQWLRRRLGSHRAPVHRLP